MAAPARAVARERERLFLPDDLAGRPLPCGSALKEHSADVTEIVRELHAQVELAKKLIPHVSYASEHIRAAAWLSSISHAAERCGLFVPGDARCRSSAVSGARAYGLRRRRADQARRPLETHTRPRLAHDRTRRDRSQLFLRAIGHPGYEFRRRPGFVLATAWTALGERRHQKRRGTCLRVGAN